MTGRPELRDMPPSRSGYYGLQRWMLIRGVPDRAWRLYWALQPLRCLLGWHNWYDVLAGEASACRCGAFGPYPNRLMHQYRWTPWLRLWAARVRDAEYRATFWYEEWLDEIKKRAAA
jgi:hypothetical protein